MGKLFGTDGIRGLANRNPLTPEKAVAVGRAIASHFATTGAPARVVIGRDTRISGQMIQSALAAGICAGGGEVLLAGVIPSPAVAFLAREMGANAGVVISASHNPYEDNGIKVFSGGGYKLDVQTEGALEQSILDVDAEDGPTHAHIGTITPLEGAAERYIAFCTKQAKGKPLAGLKLVLDCGNGATHAVAPLIFTQLGAEVISLSVAPDGININANCGSQHTHGLAAKVRETGADAGLAFDGDGDRLIAIDQTGKQLTGDHILAICALALKGTGRLAQDTLVVTPMSNLGLRTAMDSHGITVVEADVGDRNVLLKMRERGAVVGGEDSGHIILLERHTTGDGILSGIELMSLLAQSGQSLSELASVMTLAPQILINVEVSRKPPLESVPELVTAQEAAEAQLGARGRLLLRYSGTQELCRVMVESLDAELTERVATELADSVRAALS